MICLVQSSSIWPKASPGWVSLTAPDVSAGHKQLVAGLWRQALQALVVLDFKLTIDNMTAADVQLGRR